MTPAPMNVLVIGGGFFGMYLAEWVALRGFRAVLVEKGTGLMRRASYANQARVHGGYHYPRSILTALRSRMSLPRFAREFADCVDRSFEQYYMVSGAGGFLSARQFVAFCDRIGASLGPAPEKIRSLANPWYVEDVFAVEERVFDADGLRSAMEARVGAAGVDVRLGARAVSVRKEGGRLAAMVRSAGNAEDEIVADAVFSCVYAATNHLLLESGVAPVPLRHELAEIALVEPPEEVAGLGVTVMDGPFFSIMPFPPRSLHSVSHVRHTPRMEWDGADGSGARDPDATCASSWPLMVKDAARYVPVLSKCRRRDSLWEVKTILPTSESSDSRPVLFKPDHGLKGFHCVVGGKIDNIYDMMEAVEKSGVLDGG